jgi:hypothetical protein
VEEVEVLKIDWVEEELFGEKAVVVVVVDVRQ